MEVKLLRLFGFEVNSFNQSKKLFEEENANEASLDIASSIMVKTAREKTSGHELEGEKYQCQFCQRVFRNPQAMGGHQNAHKKERRLRLRKKRMQLHKTSNISNLYLNLPQSDRNPFVYHNFLPCFNASSYGDCVISFSTSQQNKNFHFDSHIPQNCKPDTSSRCEVVRPSPSYMSYSQSLYIRLGLSQVSDSCSSSRNGSS